jgi:two-component system OmpR family response regulator
MRILLIEDEHDMARYLIKALNEIHYEVIHASDAMTGLALALSEQWDLLIADRYAAKANGERPLKPESVGFDVERLNELFIFC